MGKTVEFKFAIDEEVRTRLGQDAVVRLASFDRGGIRYNVDYTNTQGTVCSGWFYENELKPGAAGDGSRTQEPPLNAGGRKEKTMGKTVEFKFAIDEEVRTRLGQDAVVRLASFDRGGIRYNVDYTNTQGTVCSEWFYENELKPGAHDVVDGHGPEVFGA